MRIAIIMTVAIGVCQAQTPTPHGATAARTRDGAGATPPAPVPDPDGGVTIFASLQKLGLALEHRKALVDQLIVDHAEKAPTEN